MMNAAQQVIATFEPQGYTYTLTVNQNGSGSGTVSGGGSFPSGTPVSPTATAAEGSTFTGWEPPSCGSTFNLTADTLCTATFTLNQYTLTVNQDGNGSGTVGGSGTFAYNTTVTPTATAALGSTFAGWNPVSCGNPFALTANTLCTANFTANPPACAAPAPGITVTQGGFLYNRVTRRYDQTVTVTNTSGSALTGPIHVALDTLSSNATLANASGVTSCAIPASPYVTVGAGPLNPNASLTVKLEFTKTASGAITYTPRVLAGAGAL